MVKDHVKNIILQKDIVMQDYNFYLCGYCFGRNFNNTKRNTVKYKTNINITKSDKKKCEICENLFEKTLKDIYDEIINSKYFNEIIPYTSIDIGTSLPFKLFEKEDMLRSLFKIKGLPNIKNQFNVLIREKIMKKTGYLLNHLNPDIKIEIALDRELNFEIKYKTKEVFLLGRYNKYKRLFSQRFKKKVNSICNQKDIQHHNLDYNNNDTIEKIILNYLYSQFSSKNIKISWLGSEDKDSLVLGSGRPFIVKVCNPSKRSFESKFEIKNMIKLNFEEIKSNDIHIYAKYKIQTKIFIKVLDDRVEEDILKRLIPQLIGEIVFYNKNKKIKKNIYCSYFKLIDDKNFELVLILDNGIPIKQLIGGEEFIEPCLSKLMDTKCECIYFDIMDISLNRN